MHFNSTGEKSIALVGDSFYDMTWKDGTAQNSWRQRLLFFFFLSNYKCPWGHTSKCWGHCAYLYEMKMPLFHIVFPLKNSWCGEMNYHNHPMTWIWLHGVTLEERETVMLTVTHKEKKLGVNRIQKSSSDEMWSLAYQFQSSQQTSM